MCPAIFSRTYSDRNASDVLNAIRRDGYLGAQMNLSSFGLESLPDRLPAGLVAEAGALAKQVGVRIAALSGTYNMVHPDASQRQASRTRFKNVVSAAQVMGAPIVSLCTESRNADNMWAAHPDNRSAGAWRDLRAELDRVLEIIVDTDLDAVMAPVRA